MMNRISVQNQNQFHEIFREINFTEKITLFQNLEHCVLFSVDKVSHFKSLTRLRDLFIKSHEIYETFETLKT